MNKWIQAGRFPLLKLQAMGDFARGFLVTMAVFFFFSWLQGGSCSGQERSDFPVNERHIVYHDVRVDADGTILPWGTDDPSEAYDRDIRLLWKFWQGMRKCPNGVPYYLQHQVWKADRDDERGLGGDQIDMTLDAWNLLYGYLGDPAILENMTLIADYWLDHGMTSGDSLWSNLPYPYNTDVHSGRYDGDMRAGKGYLQPDKAGSFGAQLVMLYKVTGNRRYLEAAVRIADTLAARAKAGDEDHSPWPFRVNATTGRVAEEERGGVISTAAYTSNWTPTLQLFSGLIELHQGNVGEYRRVSKLTWIWLKKYPMRTNKWGPFFEDVQTADYSDTEINADMMARYVLEHPERDKSWKEDSLSILHWSESRLGNHSFEKLHVTPINEQTVFLVPGNSHTSRHASAELLFCAKTGDCGSKAEAIRRLNWATYSVGEDGTNRYPNDDIWLTDGYGDYIRHYLRAMGEQVELAPRNQDHLLASTSVVQHIDYGATRVTYRKFDPRSIEKIKLGASSPVSIEGATMQWDAKSRLLTVRSSSREVALVLKKDESVIR